MLYQTTKIAILIFSFFLVPSLASAYEGCTSVGQTVVYINGIYKSEKDAKKDLKDLEIEYRQRTGDLETNFLNGYNASHLDGKGDLIKSFWQDGFSEGAVWNDYDMETILINLHSDLTTQKVLLVGHSQGAYYANQAYTYMTTHGASTNSVAVLGIATPARFVAGGGDHLNSSSDFLLNRLEESRLFKPLYRNINLHKTVTEDNLGPFLDDARRQWPGHSFSGAYLALAPSTVVSYVEKGLSGLSATTTKEDCFTPPQKGLGYTLQGAVFAVADPSAVGIRTGVTVVAGGTRIVLGGITSGVVAVGSFFMSLAGHHSEPRTTNLPGSHDIVGVLYGSSLTEDDLTDLLGTGQGGAVALAFNNPTSVQPSGPSLEPEGEVKGADIEVPSPPVSTLIPNTLDVSLVSPGFGGGGGGGATIIETSDTPAPEEPTPEEATTTPSEPDVPAPMQVVVYEKWFTGSVDGFFICGAGGCNHFNGVSRDWSWFNRGAMAFDKALVSLSTAGVSGGETLSGRLRLNLYAADTDYRNRRAGDNFIRGNLLYASDWMGLETFNTPDNKCDQYYSGGFTYEDCIFPFIFNNTVVLQEAHAYIFAFEAESFVTTQPLGPVYDQSVSLIALCSTPSFSSDYAEMCKHNAQQHMLVTFVRVGDTPTVPSVLDIAPPPPDLSIPEVTIVAGPGQRESVASTTPLSFAFSATDNASVTYMCSYNGSIATTCSSPYVVVLPDGNHYVTIDATDESGNIGSLRRHFTVLP